jgi:DNA repair exonuclease SbcCD ATPase subunit
MPELQHHTTAPDFVKIHAFLIRVALALGVILCLLVLTACPQDQTPLQSEAIQLKKQIAKLESVLQSLQEGNKVLQKQINLLNQESRETDASYEAKLEEAKNQIAQLANVPKKDVATIQALEQKNKQLQRDAKWLRSQRDHMRQSLIIQQIGGQAYELPFAFSTVSTIIEDAFTKNGYTILTTMQSDQKAIYITDRKTTLPPSLELSGFRNQYLAMIEKGPGDHTTIWIRAEFEKLSRKGHIYAAPQAELADIEMRLIQEIHQTLVRGSAAQANKF